jgi:hypothetical protein
MEDEEVAYVEAKMEMEMKITMGKFSSQKIKVENLQVCQMKTRAGKVLNFY